MSDRPTPRDWGSLLVALGITILGFSVLGAGVYADATASVSRGDFDEYRSGCDDLANQSRMVDAGMGMTWEPLNETHVRQCENTTYAEYRSGKRQSMYHAPLNPGQWALYLGLGGVLADPGAVVLRQELAAME